jgi:hypothetical protein
MSHLLLPSMENGEVFFAHVSSGGSLRALPWWGQCVIT